MQKKGSKRDNDLHEKRVNPYNRAFIALFILFISLLAISELNINNITKIMNFFKTENALPEEQVNTQLETADPEFDIKDIDDTEETDDIIEKNGQPNSLILNGKEFDNLRLIQKNIENLIQQRELSGIIGTKLTRKGLHIIVYTDTIFNPGYANYLIEGQTIIEKLARYIVIHDQHEIVVIGHANDLAPENEKLKSDWELSAMRAMQIMQVLTENITLKETKFSAKARGEKDPLITNPTKENNHLNRRVEIIVQPKSRF